MVVLNWLILLDVAEELSYNFFSLKDDSVWSPTLHDNIRFKGGPLLIEDLVLPKSFWNVQPLLHTMGHCWNNAWVIVETEVSDETTFHGNWLATKFPLFSC